MSDYRPMLRALATAAFLFTLPLATAHADPNGVANRLKAALAGQGVDLQWTGVSGDDSNMVISGVTAGAPGGKERASIGDVKLSDVSEENGGYVIGTVELPNYSVTEEGTTLNMEGLKVSGLKLPAEGGDDALAGMPMYNKAEVHGVSVKRAGKEIFTLTDLSIDVTPPEGDDPLKFEGAAQGFSADLTAVDDPKSKAVIQALGYDRIDGTFEMSGSWSPKDGRAALDNYEISVEDAGTLGISLDMSGYTPEFMKSMRELQKKSETGSEADKSSQGMAVLGLMQQLTFNGASITFEDDSLTGKVLDFVAAQQNMKRKDIANQAKAILPFMLAQLNNPEFSAQVTKAVSTFLDDPQSLKIKAAPANPVPLAMLMAGAMTAPQQLPQQLGVTVEANK